MEDRKRPASRSPSPPQQQQQGTNEADEDDEKNRLFVPSNELTSENIGEWETLELSDRQKLAWAYRTENHVRFEKLNARENHQTTTSTTAQHTTTLNSNYLLDMYPDVSTNPPTTPFQSVLERDRHAFYHRPASPFFRTSRRPDDSLTPIVLQNYERKSNCIFGQTTVGPEYAKAPTKDIPYGLNSEYLPVPPNFLMFEMVLEAYMGYDLRGIFNADDPTMPRAAVMGGAVVAALTSWRHGPAGNSQKFMQRILKLLKIKDEEEYLEAKNDLLDKWNDVFIYKEDYNPGWDQFGDPRLEEEGRNTGTTSSPFADGDVDIFLQASPHTRALNEKLMEHGLTPGLVDHISSFCGGIGLTQGDLYRFSEATTSRVQEMYEDDYRLVYSLAKNGLSFLLAPHHGRRHYYSPPREIHTMPWARTSQLIMLNHRADLLGALMDFDLSIAACAYDGTTVRVTPRAAYSLQTLACVATPYTVEETRNRKRLVKYYRRGFSTFVIDPCCLHADHCSNCTTVIENCYPSEEELRRGGAWKSHELHGREQLNEIERMQLAQRGTRPRWQRGPSRPGFIRCCDRRKNAMAYSLAMFETEEGDATKFLARLHKWSDSRLADVEKVQNELRLCCRKCRYDYGLHQFIKNEYPVDDDVDEYLRGDKSFMFGDGYCGKLVPSFYSGGTFDSKLVRQRARTDIQSCAMLRAQFILEKARYVRKHGTLDGYHQRFTFGNNLNQVFRDASNLDLPGSNRSPVGLNPERFISRCQSCTAWLHGLEFGTKFCERCDNQKPAAK